MRIIEYAVVLFLTLFENVLGYKCVDTLLFKNERLLKRREIGCIYFTIFLLSILESVNRIVSFWFSIPIFMQKLIIVSIVVWRIRKKKAVLIFCVLLICSTVVQSLDFVLGFLNVANSPTVSQQFIMYLDKGSILRDVNGLLVRVGLFFLYLKLKNEEIKIYSQVLLIILAICGYGSMIFFYIALLQGKTSLKVSVLLCLIVINILIILIIVIHSIFHKNEEKMKIILMQNGLLEKNYNNYCLLYRENKYLSHDLKNHLNLLETFIAKGDEKQALAYIKRIKEPSDKVEAYVHSDNSVVDTILNYKLSEATRKGIIVMQEVDSVAEISMEDKDICIIFSNLLDNAIEACEKIKDEEKWIKLVLKREGNILIYKIENPYVKVIPDGNGKYKTDKRDREQHGIGLESVEYTVEKYGGDLSVEVGEKTFRVRVVLFI